MKKQGRSKAQTTTALGKRMDALHDKIVKLLDTELDVKPEDTYLSDYDIDPADGAEINFILDDEIYSVVIKRMR